MTLSVLTATKQGEPMHIYARIARREGATGGEVLDAIRLGSCSPADRPSLRPPLSPCATAGPMAERKSVVVWNQLGAEATRAIMAAVPEVKVVEISGDPALPEPAASVLLAAYGVNHGECSWARPVSWVETFSTGIDGYPPALLKGRRVTSSRGSNAAPIAEFVLAAMLAREKQLPEVWDPGYEGLGAARLGALAHTTLGILGLGTIGRAVAHRALAFDMTVLASRARPRPSPIPGVEVAAFEQVLARSDHLVLAAPLTPSTERVVNAASLGRMKRGVHLVNVSRGALVDQDALLAALDSGQVGRATLDVTDPEPLPPDHPLRRHSCARISSHVSWSSPRLMQPGYDHFCDNLRRFIDGRPLVDIVDVDAGY